MKRCYDHMRLRDDRKGVFIYMPTSLHRHLKIAAATSGVSLSAYVVARLLAAGDNVMVGDIVAAPKEGK